MRLPSILAFVCCILGGTYTGTTAAEQKSAQAEVAMRYLNQLAQGTLILEDHTALSKHCGQERLKELRERIDFLREHQFRDNDLLSVEAIKTDTDLAGVLIRADNPAIPLGTRIHSVALLKRKNNWAPAPLPGLFSNTGYGYDEKIEQLAKSLERWMAGEKIIRQIRYRNKAMSTLKSDLAAIEKKAGHDKMNAEQTVDYFIEQCRQKNLYGILVGMGAASDALQEPMELLINNISLGLEIEDQTNSWYFLANSAVIAQLLDFDKTSKEMAVGFYNPMATQRSQKYKILYFPTHQTGGKTFVRLDPDLVVELLPHEERIMAKPKDHRNERDLKIKLPSAILKNAGTVDCPTPEQLVDHCLRAYGNSDFRLYLSLTTRDGKHFGDPAKHESALSELGYHWRHTLSLEFVKEQDSGTIQREILTDGDLSLALFQHFTKNQLGQFATHRIWMMKDRDGWHIVKPEGSKWTDINHKASADKINKRVNVAEAKLREKCASEFLNQLVAIDPTISLNPVSNDEALKTLANYRGRLRSPDPQTALAHCAVQETTAKLETIKAFGYAVRGASDHTDKDKILGTINEGNWTAVSVRTQSKLSGLHDYPLYVVVKTTSGPRILIDADLRYGSNKGRQLLNKKNWRKLEETLPRKSVDTIKLIFDEHSKLCEEDINKIQASEKSE